MIGPSAVLPGLHLNRRGQDHCRAPRAAWALLRGGDTGLGPVDHPVDPESPSPCPSPSSPRNSELALHSSRSAATSSRQLPLILLAPLQSILSKKKKNQTSAFLGNIRIIFIIYYCSYLIPRTGLCHIELAPSVSQSCVGFSGTGLVIAFHHLPFARNT